MQNEITNEFLESQGFSHSFPSRFWAQVDKTENCWLWNGVKLKAGYGIIFTSRHHGGRFHILAHRASWILANRRSIPAGMFICHICDTKMCVRPDHLFLGTAKDNSQDMVQKGRAIGGKRKLTPEQVVEMRKLKGKMTLAEIGKIYRVSPSNVWWLFNRDGWKHIKQ